MKRLGLRIAVQAGTSQERPSSYLISSTERLRSILHKKTFGALFSVATTWDYCCLLWSHVFVKSAATQDGSAKTIYRQLKHG